MLIKAASNFDIFVVIFGSGQLVSCRRKADGVAVLVLVLRPFTC